MALVDEYDLLFAERSQTRPVKYAGRVTRAFFDQAGSIRTISHAPIQVEHDTLYIRAGALGQLTVDDSILVGDVGGDTADAGMEYQINLVNPIDDGLITAIHLSGGDA